jgi:glyceraldehyde 3-phosphate dehydrogenase
LGRIGRMCMRAALGRKDIEVVAVNGTNSPREAAQLLKYDSVHGKFKRDVEANDKELIVDGVPIRYFSDRDLRNLPWGDWNIDVVIESTGKFNSGAECKTHLRNGAKKVIITAPAKDDTPTIVMGVNERIFNPLIHHVVSNASCTTNCLAPIAKVINDVFGIENGMMTTVHAFTSDQRNLDNNHKDPRRARGCMQSMVPTSTGAAKAIGLILPELAGKLNGISIRVPIPNVSLVDLVVELSRHADALEINAVLKEAAGSCMKGIIGYCDEPLVSIDFVGNSHSAIVDAFSTMVVKDRTVKILAWYDNEWGYSCRVIDLAGFIGAHLHQEDEHAVHSRIAG